METFGDLFESYWWLLFPLAFFVIGGWNSFLSYQRTKAKVEVLKAYAQSGKEPPADLIRALESENDRSGDDWSDGGKEESGGSGVFLVVLFAGLSAVFAFVGYSGWLGDTTSMYFVAMILGVLALAFLASSLFGKRRG
ncbi:hypothetical protein [Hyphobacterium indicum]|uniref:hypothetical protein n=1 Tax=Hyphobacterium indicum TaxID=2162714 RepID=UPI000D649CC3|nr:hypothetical protein [Hyphobacterium indicum]|tara:strand:- start:32 stop:445 length:414 start_codon:yes stop_codon:yes gene_type:complete